MHVFPNYTAWVQLGVGGLTIDDAKAPSLRSIVYACMHAGNGLLNRVEKRM